MGYIDPMSSLADLPELVGFFSYSREDDEDSSGALSALRDRIQRELRGQLGRSMKTFRLWQDKEAIASGKLWEAEIKAAVAQSAFFIPIITPTVVRSRYCRIELESFLSREAVLDRNDLIFPILYIRVPALEDSARQQNDPVISIIAERQYLDWREFRHRDTSSPEVKEAIERFCTNICDALYRTWHPPEERKKREEAAAQQIAEAELKNREAETKRREEEVRKKAELEAKERADDEQRRRDAEAEQQRAKEQRERANAEATRLAREKRHRAEAAQKAIAETAIAAKANAAAGRAASGADSGASSPGLQETITTPAPPTSASWLDLRAWSYSKIAVAALSVGIIVGLTNVAGLYGGIALGRIYIFSVSVVVYSAAISLLATKLTINLGLPRLAIAFLSVYVVIILYNIAATSISQSITDAPTRTGAIVLNAAVWKTVLWLVVDAIFLPPRASKDKKMLAIAMATGAIQAAVATFAYVTLPSQLSAVSTAAFGLCITAVMLAYGIRRQQGNAIGKVFSADA
jgi:hypothetical protein